MRSHVSNAELIANAKVDIYSEAYDGEAGALTRASIKSAVYGMAYGVRSFGRSAGQMAKAARELERAMTEIHHAMKPVKESKADRVLNFRLFTAKKAGENFRVERWRRSRK